MQPASETVAPGDARLLRSLLPVSVFVSGAVVMVLEVLGTRLIAPVYGTSLHVWSAIIAVTLLSLSVGYWLGGRFADRHQELGATAWPLNGPRDAQVIRLGFGTVHDLHDVRVELARGSE